MCLGVVTTVVTTGAAGLLGDELPLGRGRAGLEAVVQRGDAFEVTVYTVSGVDAFEAMEPATGFFFEAHVHGVRRSADCWLDESRATAQELLGGKKVRLTVKKEGASGSDRISVDVRLPDGTDYAQTVVSRGVALADLPARDELGTVESAARRERRGLWAAGCVPDEATATPSSAPSSSVSSAASTTTTAPSTTVSSAPASSAPVTSTSSAPPDDARIGKFCLIEGSRRTSPNGREIVCARNEKNQLRWRRAE
jgi:endonuclease YncB( thermonuclease family)